MEYPEFCGGGSESQSPSFDQEHLCNLYVERADSPGYTSRSALMPTPGVEIIQLTLPNIPQPDPPVITNQGTPGSTSYKYVIVGLLGDGTTHSERSNQGITNTGNGTLSVTDFNRITWTASPNAVSYQVYLTEASGVPIRDFLGTTTALTFDHNIPAPFPDPGETAPTDNTTGIAFTPSGTGRAHFFENGREFAVIGPIFYEIGQGGLATPWGTVAIGGNPATISSNGDGGGQLYITSGDNGYIFDVDTHVFTQVTALNGKATMGGFIDGYFLNLDAASSTLSCSDLYDGLTWDPTQFAQRSRAPDPWASMVVSGLYIWLLGEQTSEPWYNAGSTFPFAPYPSVLVPYGIVAPFSAVVSEGVIRWLGGSSTGQRYALQATGFTAEVISDFPRQWIFSQYNTVADAQAIVFNYIGHTFYQISFPTEDITWTWDATSGVWSQWGTWVSEGNEYVAWRPRWHAMAYGEHRMLDANMGFLYRMSAELTLDVDGREIVRERRAPGLTAELERIYYASFTLDLEVGLGTSTGQGVNPQLMLQISTDGGKTWGNERWVTAGRMGQYWWRAMWERCGAARRAVFRVRFSDPTPLRVTNAYLELGQPVKALQQQQKSA